MGCKRDYYTDPYSSFSLDIHREFPIPVPMHMTVLRDDIELYTGKDGLRYFAPIGAAPLLAKVPAVAKIAEGIKNVLGKVGIGGVTQDRFIDRTSEVYKIFKAAGYTTEATNYDSGITYRDYDLGKSQVTNRKSNGNYEPEFRRLHDYIVDRANAYNPGLGDAWAYYFPEFKMANLGNIYGAPLDALKEVLMAYPPFTFDPEEEMLSVPEQTSKPSAAAPETKLPSFESARKDLTAAQLALLDNPKSKSKVPQPEDEKKEAKTQQVVTYVTLGMAVVILVVAIVMKLKGKAA